MVNAVIRTEGPLSHIVHDLCNFFCDLWNQMSVSGFSSVSSFMQNIYCMYL